MDEALKKMLTQLGESVKALNEAVATKFSSADPAAAEAEKDKLVAEVRQLQEDIKTLKKQKAISKMVWAIQGKHSDMSEGTKALSMGDFLKAVFNKDEKFLEEAGVVKTANGQSEGTSADGGFTVPTEYANEIVKLERQFSIVRRICRLFPMGSLTRLVPRQLTNPTVTWTAEATNHTKTKATFEQITQTAKKVSALVPMTEELLADNNVNLDTFLFQVVAEAIGREEDRVALAGNAGGSDPFNGVLYATGVNNVSMAGATLNWTDLVDIQMALKAPYRARGRFVIGSTALGLVMKLKDDYNRPIWTMPDVGSPGVIMGKPYDETDGTAMASIIEFGDWGNYLWISDRGGYDVKASDSASDANGAAGSAFLQDEIWYKFRRRENIVVAQPEAFAKMTVA